MEWSIWYELKTQVILIFHAVCQSPYSLPQSNVCFGEYTFVCKIILTEWPHWHSQRNNVLFIAFAVSEFRLVILQANACLSSYNDLSHWYVKSIQQNDVFSFSYFSNVSRLIIKWKFTCHLNSLYELWIHNVQKTERTKYGHELWA